jgi:hypothetical protein
MFGTVLKKKSFFYTAWMRHYLYTVLQNDIKLRNFISFQ